MLIHWCNEKIVSEENLISLYGVSRKCVKLLKGGKIFLYIFAGCNVFLGRRIFRTLTLAIIQKKILFTTDCYLLS